MVSSDSRAGVIKNSAVRILQISDDPELTETRLRVLRNAGFEVEHCASGEFREHGSLERFDIFFFCQSIDPQSARDLAIRIRREAPRSRILRMRARRADYDHLANLYLTPPAEPEELIHALELLATTLPDHRSSAHEA